MIPDPWPAPVAETAIDATVTVPGSKSIANRALILAALADGGSTLTNMPLGARDIHLMIAALRSLGCQITEGDSGHVTVRPDELRGPAVVDCGLSGTVMRFVPPVAGLAVGDVRFDGDPRARERPLQTLVEAMRDLGVLVEDNGHARLPVTIHGTGRVTGGRAVVDAGSSSQFVSALLLSGARFDRGVRVSHRGAALPSLPHIEMTCRMLAQQGVDTIVDIRDRSHADWIVRPATLEARSRTVEPDLSNAAPLAAAALVTGGRVVVADWPEASLQPSEQLRAILEAMGGTTEFVGGGLAVSGDGSIRAVDESLRDIPEAVPTIAALCALADGPSRLTGIGHMTGHETDRLRAIADEINGLGGQVTADEDGLLITPAPLHGGTWGSYHDHRMATTGALLGLVVPGVLVENVATTAKTFPNFSTVWQSMVGASADNGV